MAKITQAMIDLAAQELCRQSNNPWPDYVPYRSVWRTKATDVLKAAMKGQDDGDG